MIEQMPRDEGGCVDWETYAAIIKSKLDPTECAALRRSLLETDHEPEGGEYDVSRKTVRRHATGGCSCGAVHDEPPIERRDRDGVWVTKGEDPRSVNTGGGRG